MRCVNARPGRPSWSRSCASSRLRICLCRVPRPPSSSTVRPTSGSSASGSMRVMVAPAKCHSQSDSWRQSFQGIRPAWTRRKASTRRRDGRASRRAGRSGNFVPGAFAAEYTRGHNSRAAIAWAPFDVAWPNICRPNLLTDRPSPMARFSSFRQVPAETRQVLRDRFASKLRVQRQPRFLDPNLEVTPDQLALRLLGGIKISTNAQWQTAEAIYAAAGPTGEERANLPALANSGWVRRIWGRVAIPQELRL